MIWFGWLLWHINHCRFFLIPNPLYTYMSTLYDFVWFGWVKWHINHCRSFNAKSYLYTYIKYIWFVLVGFYGISTIASYLIPNPSIHIYIIYMICLGATPFSWLLHFTLDPYLIILSVNQGVIKYYFLTLWYDSTRDWTPVSRAIGENSTIKPMGRS